MLQEQKLETETAKLRAELIIKTKEVRQVLWWRMHATVVITSMTVVCRARYWPGRLPIFSLKWNRQLRPTQLRYAF